MRYCVTAIALVSFLLRLQGAESHPQLSMMSAKNYAMGAIQLLPIRRLSLKIASKCRHASRLSYLSKA